MLERFQQTEERLQKILSEQERQSQVGPSTGLAAVVAAAARWRWPQYGGAQWLAGHVEAPVWP
jgi:transposase